MEEKSISTNESLEIIDRMINTAKNKLAEDGFLPVLWGWLVFVSAISSYIGIMVDSEYGYYSWMILMPLGAVVSIVYGVMQGKKERVRAYMDVYLGFTWGAFIIALFVTLGFMVHHGVKITYFFIMILYGMSTFISGGLLNFRPLIIGSMFSFVMAVASVFADYSQQFLCIAVAVLFSYIIPGHMLRLKHKSQNV